MIDSEKFKLWIENNTSYSPDVINDTVSRMRRADKILEWDNTNTYLFFLEKEDKFKSLSVSVRSQIRKSVHLYCMFTGLETK